MTPTALHTVLKNATFICFVAVAIGLAARVNLIAPRLVCWVLSEIL